MVPVVAMVTWEKTNWTTINNKCNRSPLSLLLTSHWKLSVWEFVFTNVGLFPCGAACRESSLPLEMACVSCYMISNQVVMDGSRPWSRWTSFSLKRQQHNVEAKRTRHYYITCPKNKHLGWVISDFLQESSPKSYSAASTESECSFNSTSLVSSV